MLNKFMYGFEQAPRCSNKKFQVKVNLGLIVSPSKQVEGDTINLALFMDDGFVALETESALNHIVRKSRKAVKAI